MIKADREMISCGLASEESVSNFTDDSLEYTIFPFIVAYLVVSSGGSRFEMYVEGEQEVADFFSMELIVCRSLLGAP